VHKRLVLGKCRSNADNHIPGRNPPPPSLHPMGAQRELPADRRAAQGESERGAGLLPCFA